MLHGGRGLQQAIASRRPGEAVARAAHCCVGAAVVGVEDGTAIGARVGAVVVGLRMRTSVGAIPCRHFRVATIDPFAQKRRGSCVRWSNRARHRRRWESGKLCWPADRRVPVNLGSGAGQLVHYQIIDVVLHKCCMAGGDCSKRLPCRRPGEAVARGCALLRGCGGGRSRRRHGSRC